MNALETLRQGIDILSPVMRAHGFEYREEGSGRGSGGEFARGRFKKGDRILEIHFRHHVGLVDYHVGSDSIRHEVLMRALLGRAGGNHYPGFSDDPMEGFRGLKHDLEHFADDFLAGSGDAFRKGVEQARGAKKLTGLQRAEQGWPTALAEMR